MNKISYPIKFEPILVEKVWGGEKLMNLLNKKSSKDNIGESWEVSGLESGLSIVSNGELKGYSLTQLIEDYKIDFLGVKVYETFGNEFPLLVKYIDAKSALSVQLHPNDDLAKARHNSFGKTEMWHIMDAEMDSKLIVGLKEGVTESKYLQSMSEQKVVETLNSVPVAEGDTYFIPAGCIHAIGGGVLLAEIQQTSDVTYRIYDWDRPDVNGDMRELHNDLALDAIDFSQKQDYKSSYLKEVNKVNRAVSCEYFTTNVFCVEGVYEVDHSDKDSFVIYMCTKGNAQFEYSGKVEEIKMGETVLIPACLKHFKIISDNYSELLEVFIE